MTRLKTLFVIFLLVVSSQCEDSDLTFENDNPRNIQDSNSNEERLLERVYRFKDQLLGNLYDYVKSVTDSTDDVPKKEDLSISEERNKTQENNSIENDIPKRFKRSDDYNRTPADPSFYDDEDLDAYGSGLSHSPSFPAVSGVSGTPEGSPDEELVLRISFVILEPYQEALVSRDSEVFQKVARIISDSVAEVFDPIPGEQRARLVRIEHRSVDAFTCRVTIELQTIGNSNVAQITQTLYNHLKTNHRLGDITASSDEFHYEKVRVNGRNEFRCPPHEMMCRTVNPEDEMCFPIEKRCDGYKDCPDGSDEVGCNIEDNTVTDRRLETPVSPNIDRSISRDFMPPQTHEDFPDVEPSPPPEEDYPTGETITLAPQPPDTSNSTESSTAIPQQTSTTETARSRGDIAPSNEDIPDDDQDYYETYDEEDEKSSTDTSEIEPTTSTTPKPNPSIEKCEANEFQCDVTRCIDMSSVCDGIEDCMDSTDELNCGNCRADDFRCDDGSCIEKERICNQVVDCRGGEDERNCPCQANDFRCGDGACIEQRKRCDGVVNCADGSDENGCQSCTPDQWQCDYGTCIAKTKRCDGRIDCPTDRSDERHCVAPSGYCRGIFFKCTSGECVSPKKVCNYEINCVDGSDEKYCTCPNDKYHCRHSRVCIQINKLCDGRIDCPDGDDESRCEYCADFEYHCGFNKCIPEEKVCDGVFDCESRFDEYNCQGKDKLSRYTNTVCQPPNSFTCTSTGHCLPPEEECNGIRSCPNGEDEADCGATCLVQCDNGTCLDLSSRCNGVPECPDGEDERDCECDPYQFRCDDGSCIHEDHRCNGIAECTDGSDEINCSGGSSSCAQDEFQCTSGQCISMDFRCDQNPDCLDNSDEINCNEHCEKEGGIFCDGKCIEENFICDGHPDCSDNRDEDGEICNTKPAQCATYEFICEDNGCIHHSLRCDGKRDCKDGSDEIGCMERCNSEQYQCPTGECVDMNLVCDGFSDCTDGSDETIPLCRNPPRDDYTTTPRIETTPLAPRWPTRDPPEEGGCRRDEWRCENGPCILKNLRCNGAVDCPFDNSDELDCATIMSGGLNLKTYPNDQIIKQSPYPKGGEVVFQCRDEGPMRAPVKWLREGGRPLPAGSTDRNGRLEMPNIQVSDSGTYICQAVGYQRYTPGSELSVRLTVEPYEHIMYRPAEACKLDEATCSNGDCIPKNQVCNGHYDCTDGSDEQACNVHGMCEPNEFKCANKRCILRTWMCDSEDDCKDGSDEANCGMSSPGNTCHPYEFQCKSGRQCISRSFHCDGQNDCFDKSDEENCSPVFISRPPPPMMILEEHSTMTISCIALGTPTPVVVWRLNWGHIPQKCTTTSEGGVGTLRCPDVRPQDQGAYSCEALNNRGSVFAVPDTILVVNTSKSDICPSGYFNSEARSPQECISCFCFGTTSECKSADLFTYQIPPPLSRSGIRLIGVSQQPGQPLQITDEPISGIFDLVTSDDGITINRVGSWSPRNIYPYMALSENYLGTQLKSYGGYIKFNARPTSNMPPPPGYLRLPDVILKGGNILLTHTAPLTRQTSGDRNIRLFQGQWNRVTPYGSQSASREDIMMVLANIDTLLLRAEDNGYGVEITNFLMDSAGSENSGQGLAAYVEECKCPQGYSGLSCQKCSPGYMRVESGQWLGRCVRDEEPCQAGYYGNPSAGISCQPCPCPHTNPGNQFSRSCRLENDGDITCQCPVGYMGRRCQECATGYVGNPTIPGGSCRPAPPLPMYCDVRGTSSQDGNVCRCKPNVVGTRCNECADESFFLSLDNPFGCSQCFCMGVTRTCTSSTMRRNTISAKFATQNSVQSIKLIEWDEQPENIKIVPSNAIRSNPSRQEISYGDFQRDSGTFYWQLPDRFSGEKLTAYGGFLNYTIRFEGNMDEEYLNSDADVLLVSNNDIVLSHSHGSRPGRDGIISESVQLLEQYWQRSGDDQQSDREHMLMALADLQGILIKATYSSDARSAALISASVQVADERGVGERASHVEECQCPQGYLGTSCQDCAPGYSRIMEGLYLGFCSLCDCNDHSSECHPETGDCLNCQHNTYGKSCEFCLPGYEGNATSGLPNACRPKDQGPPRECSCDARGTIAPFCYDNDMSCRCKPNVEGDRCDRCRPGTFKLSESNPQGCMPCYCSGVSDQCSEAHHLYKLEIPIGIIDDTHGFTITSLDQNTVYDDNFQLDVPLNQISYNFGGRPPTERLFWSLPNTFTGNKITSYNGSITVTQKYSSNDNREYASDDVDVVLVGSGDTIYWKNPRRLRSNTPMTYSIPLSEHNWMTLSSGEAPHPVSHEAFLDILSNIRLILVRATLSPTITKSYIADVAMDIAVPAESGQPLAESIELCRCPPGFSGTSCESCSSGYYRTSSNRCERCPCSGREEACRLEVSPYNTENVVCTCKPGYYGNDCSSTEEVTQPPPYEPPTEQPQVSIQVIISAPKIQNQPEGGTVRFICTARSVYASSPIRVSWRKEGGNLPLGRFIEDPSRGILTINDLKVSDSGSYICQASDGITTGSDRASLTVPRQTLIPPQLTIDPPILEVYEGEPIEIRCIVTGYPTPSVTWNKVNKRNMNPQHSFIDGIFRISSARQSDQGEYRCTAESSVGKDSKAAMVYVNPQQGGSPSSPVLSVNPAHPIVREGDSLTIVCSVDQGVPASFITWTREDGYLPQNFRSQNGQLWIDSIRYEDGGVYRCSADRFPSRVTPASVVITVQSTTTEVVYNASVAVETDRAIVPEGMSYTVKCEPRGYPPLVIKWTKSGSEFGPGVTQRGNALVINQAIQSDAGVYVCIGSTYDNTPIAQDSVYLTIERRENPEVRVWPEGIVTVTPGGNARLQCRIMAGSPDPILTWSRPSGRPLTSNTHLKPDGILSFTNISVHEEGTYTCTGSNTVGQRSANATIKMLSSPVITISPDTYIVAVPGQQVEVKCRAVGYPTPEVTWIHYPDQDSSNEHQLASGRYGNATLIINYISEREVGMYVCMARNEAGVIEERVSIVLDSVPERGDIPGPVPAKVSISSAKNLTASDGDSLRIDCKGSGRVDRMEWVKVNTREYLNIEKYPSGSVLILNDIRENDAGVYRCEGYEENQLSTTDEIILNVLPTSTPDDRMFEYQGDEPEVVSAKIGSMVLLPCHTNMPTPVMYQWIRPHAQLPRNVQDRQQTLRLNPINESDAGSYICRVSHGNIQKESRMILRVTHVIPKFNGNGYLSMKTLEDAFLFFDIEVTIKPQGPNGIILYNSFLPGTVGDMVSLSLVDRVPEFRFDLSPGSSVIIRGDRELSYDEWHTIKITRGRRDGFMYVDDKGPFTGQATSVSQGLDLTGPLYIGGVDDVSMLLDDFHPKTGFVGCIGRLVLNGVDVSLMEEAIEKVYTEDCDTCSQNPCLNNGVCQESLNNRGYTCICADGFSGMDCAGMGESCMPGICGPGRCTDTTDGFQCTCPIGYAGQRCESRIDIEYPAFGGKAYLAFPAPQTGRRLRVSLRIKPSSQMGEGLILYSAESRHGGHGDFTSLAMRNGYLEYRYSLGGDMVVLRSVDPIPSNQWTNVTILRINSNGVLNIDGQPAVNGQTKVRKSLLQLRTPMYIGGYDSNTLVINKKVEVDDGFIGCIADVKISDEKLDIMDSSVQSANIQNCGDNDYDYRPNNRDEIDRDSRPQRGDIPEYNTVGTNEDEGICPYCRNGGYCESNTDTSCVCPPEFTGVYCESQLETENQFSPCDRQPCENGGTCRPTRQGSLYKCDCPKGTGGFNCRNRVFLGTNVSLSGEGYLELPSYMFTHRDPRESEVFAIAFMTQATDGLLVYQGDNSTNPREGDFIMLSINGGYVVFEWNLGTGVGSIVNTRVLVSDNQRHQVIVMRAGLDATLTVDSLSDEGRAPGMTRTLNADSNIYIGGVPSHLTQTGIIGFSGCIHQFELLDSKAINFGQMAIASRNANTCSQNGDVSNGEGYYK